MAPPARLRPYAVARTPLVVLALGFGAPPLSAQLPEHVDPARVDSVFRAFDNRHGPGCVVGVSRRGAPVLLRAYGMADLERDVPNTPWTVMEPGSVAKQFTAAAVVLLALDGSLSLDDDVRSWIPELPDYGEKITIRHLLNHTSGLRDWGSVAGIEGWPRTRRAHTHAHVLDIVARQRELNYRPGEYYSYTNTGYNLQAILVERVSGMTFADFTRERIFEPLGMSRTQWRDDFNRVVRDRALAYRPEGTGRWSMLMPFEDVHGNGGLLTTVEDLLRFTQNLETGDVGGRRFVEEMHRQGILNSGEVISYASGVQVGTYRGVPQVQHSGSTAGYRGHLARFPEQEVAVAVMCNASSGNATQLTYRVADLYLAGSLVGEEAEAPEEREEATTATSGGFAGAYRDTRTGQVVRLAVSREALVVGGVRLLPVDPLLFRSASGAVALSFEGPAVGQTRTPALLSRPGEPNVRIEPVELVRPSASVLAAYAGTYRSDEAEATYRVVATDGALSLVDRWGGARTFNPAYADVFTSGGVTLVFRRGAGGRVEGLRWSEGRVWGLAFVRVEG